MLQVTCPVDMSDSSIEPTLPTVCVTDSSVSLTNALYPVGAKGVLGYGVNGPASPANASLIPTFLPCVNSGLPILPL
jgi:hypothetical protein